ncbi:MAG: hypothetical protein ACJ73L_04050 [Actinomycetes bacterium]
MQAMAWWLIPITATLLAVAWVTWSARPRRPADPHETLAAHRRFTEALSPPTPIGPASGDGVDQLSNKQAVTPSEQRRSA